MQILKVVTIGLFISTNILFAQNFKIYGGIVLPTGDLAKQSGEEAGYAIGGPTFGIEYAYQIDDSYFSLAGNIMVNRCYLDYPRSIENDFYDSNGYWTSIPITFGIKYNAERYLLKGLFFEAGAGFNITEGPSYNNSRLRIQQNIEKEYNSIDYKSTYSFVFFIGTGIKIHRRLQLMLRYLDLGEPEYMIEAKRNQVEPGMELIKYSRVRHSFGNIQTTIAFLF